MITETVIAAPAGPLTKELPVHPGLWEHVARPHVGFTDPSTGQDSWVEYPNGMVTVIVNIGEAFGSHPLAFVAGLTQRREVIERDGPIECLDLKLTPPGARRLFGRPVEELTGADVRLGDVLGRSEGDILERVAAEPTWTARARLLDQVLLRRHDANADGLDARIKWAWQCIETRHGQVSTGELARVLGWSQRHFIASFRRQLGLTPHKLARITRFNAALSDLRDAHRRGGAGCSTRIRRPVTPDSRRARVHRSHPNHPD